MLRIVVWLLILAALVASWYFWMLFRRALLVRRVERAVREFDRRRPELEQLFCTEADATGKPRGLRWKKCDLQHRLIVARDRANGELVGLVGVTIHFEAIEGGGMEDVAAVGNLRAATAIFQWNGRAWTTQGKAVFNLEPREVLDRYGDSLDVLFNEPVTL